VSRDEKPSLLSKDVEAKKCFLKMECFMSIGSYYVMSMQGHSKCSG